MRSIREISGCSGFDFYTGRRYEQCAVWFLFLDGCIRKKVHNERTVSPESGEMSSEDCRLNSNSRTGNHMMDFQENGLEDKTTSQSAFSCPHGHSFLPDRLHAHERRTWWVIGLTVTTMVLEIASGLLFGSMALLADGWHMASHASAMGITALAYSMSRKHKDNPRFTFGTGKIGDLAAYSSALLLLVVAALMAYESILRLTHPLDIHFKEAMLVAALGLVVNLVSALLLREHPHD